MPGSTEGFYYYHGDHLGSSSVVTDSAKNISEHLEYFPYGETWLQEKASSTQEMMPYRFTAKEQDTETGLYYFGARYYEPKSSKWASADPFLGEGKYFPKPNDFDADHDYYWQMKNEKIKNLTGNGGIYSSINLDPYKYCSNNPLKFIDPNGLVDLNLFSEDNDSFRFQSAENAPSPPNTFTVGSLQ